MFPPKEVPRYQKMLENELERTISTLKISPIHTDEYVKALTIVERLNDMVDREKPDKISKNTMLMVGANLLGIVMVIKHESVNVITSKALSFVIRPR